MKIKVVASCPWEIVTMKVNLAFAVVLATARLTTAAELAVNKNDIVNTLIRLMGSVIISFRSHARAHTVDKHKHMLDCTYCAVVV